MKKYFILFLFISIFLLIGTVGATDASGNDNLYTDYSWSTSSNSSSLLNETNLTEYKKNELFVRFKSNITDFENVSKNAHLKTGATVLKEYKDIKGLQLVKIPDNINLSDAIAIYLSNTNILYAEPNYIYKTETIPDDAHYNSLWGLSRINATDAWDITTGSSNVIIAVVDSGIDLLHLDLKGNIWTNEAELNGISGVDDDGNEYIDDIYGWNFLKDTNNVTDDNGHGTHVAGIIAATGNNTEGVTGVTWNAKIMALKFLDANGYGYVEDAVNAINYAAKMGAHIINNSWGGSTYSQALKDAIDACNALVVCAAGNEYSGVDNDKYPNYPSSFTSNNIIAVAAINGDDNIAYFSNYGVNSVDVAAPGSNIYSTVPQSSYGYLSGTSMATPYVSGLAALIKSMRPDLNVLQVKYTILNNVDFISSLSGKISTSGVINAYKSLTNIVTDITIPRASADSKGGHYNITQMITLSMNETGNIYYTTNGATPTKASTKYTDPIIINSTTILKFFAVDESGNPSKIYTETYVIDTVKPTVSANPKGGLYNTNKVIYLKMNESGTIYYTKNGTTPTTSSTRYTGTFTISSSTILKFFAVDLAGNPSSVYTEKYTFDKVAPKVISTIPKNGATGFSRGNTVTIRFSENIKTSSYLSKIYIKNLKTGRIVSLSKWVSGNTLYLKMTYRRYAYTWYKVYIPGGAVKDSAGNNGVGYSFTFKTGRY
ncbi:S8 family serine peptidase [Methanobacterium oryzae]|uniref:S8 family serine peptidase n=1 Tax=Methanobacterium oryzae TaxID=69540 RepID=UPI003D23473E